MSGAALQEGGRKSLGEPADDSPLLWDLEYRAWQAGNGFALLLLAEEGE